MEAFESKKQKMHMLKTHMQKIVHEQKITRAQKNDIYIHIYTQQKCMHKNGSMAGPQGRQCFGLL